MLVESDMGAERKGADGEVFVGRNGELVDFARKVNMLQEYGYAPVVNYYGERGSGKSAFIAKCVEICNATGTRSVIIDFDTDRNPNADRYGKDRLQLQRDVLEQLGDSWENQEADEVSEDDSSAQITFASGRFREGFLDEEVEQAERYAKRFADITKERGVVLFVDSTSEVDELTDRWLELTILQPLSDGNMIVLTSDHYPRQFVDLWVRRDTQQKKLASLDKEEATEQYHRLGGLPKNEALYDSFQKITKGNPKANRILTEGLNSLDPGMPDIQKRKALISGLAQEYVYDYVFEGLKQGEVEALRLLSVARVFDVMLTRRFLAMTGRIDEGDTIEAMQIFRDIRKVDQVRWDDVRKAFILPPTVRQILHAELPLNNTELFEDLNEEAIDFWRHAQVQDGMNFPMYVEEELYHLSLRQGVNSKDILTRFKERLGELSAIDEQNRLLTVEHVCRVLEDDEEVRAALGDRVGEAFQFIDSIRDKIILNSSKNLKNRNL